MVVVVVAVNKINKCFANSLNLYLRVVVVVVVVAIIKYYEIKHEKNDTISFFHIYLVL